MGINTAMFQTGIVSKLKFNTIVPAKIFARLNINEGNFKIGALPVTLPENITAVQWVWYMSKDTVFKAFK